VNVTFANPLAWWALALVVGAAAALAWLAYRGIAGSPARRGILSALRFLTLLLLVVVLMRPVTTSTGADARDVVVPVLVDTSRSMAIEDAGGARRIDRARALVETGILPALSAHFTVDVLSFGEALPGPGVMTFEPTARRSDLAGALNAVRDRYRGRPVAGVIVLTDGGDTGGQVGAAAFDASVPPVYPLGVGSPVATGDREVLSVTAAEAVLDGSLVDLAVSAVAHETTDTTAELRLLENGRPREVRHVRLPAGGGPIREVFQVAPGAGTATVYTVEIPARAGELVPENNARSVLVQPPARQRRVLLVEGAPGFEHTFLKRALDGDRSLTVDAVVRKGKNEQGTDTYYIQAARGRSAALTSGYPRDAASLFAYDAILLANVGSDQLTDAQLQATRAFVARRGGGLLVFGAQSFLNRGLVGTAVEDALPVQFDRRAEAVPAMPGSGTNRAQLTEAGGDHPVTRLGATAAESRKRWDALPALASTALLGALRPGAEVLATGAAGGAVRPLIAVQRYGDGRSMVFAGEAAWRWRMMLPSSDRTYETFWRQSVRWLSLGATDPVTIFPIAAAGPGDAVPIKLAVRNAAFEPLAGAQVDVRIAGPDGRMDVLRAARDVSDGDEPGLFVAAFEPSQPGMYRASASARLGDADAGTATAAVLVGGADAEMADPRLNVALLERLAVTTGGRVVTEADLGELAETLRASMPAAAFTVRTDLWHNAWSFALLLGLLSAEWILRRRWGLR
jgi:uncharacterized membrane protein